MPATIRTLIACLAASGLIACSDPMSSWTPDQEAPPLNQPRPAVAIGEVPDTPPSPRVFPEPDSTASQKICVCFDCGT